MKINIHVLLCLFSITSCGDSPLLNHSFEKSLITQNTVFSESETLKFKKEGYSFAISWQEGPQLGGSQFVLKSWKNDLGTINGPYQDLQKNLHIFLWMPAMGHGSSPVKIKKIGQGEYEVSEVQFLMGGKWEIKFQLKKNQQVFDEAIVSLSL